MNFTQSDLEMAHAFKNTFGSSSGQIVLKELDRLYFTQNLHVAGDPYASHVNIGAHMVLAAIYQLIQLASDPQAAGNIILGEFDHG